MSKPIPTSPRADFRVTETAIEQRTTRRLAVTPDGVEIEITLQQMDDNIFERGTPLKVQLGRPIAHVKYETTWQPLAHFAPRAATGNGALN